MFPKQTLCGLSPSGRKEVGMSCFPLKAICSQGVVLLAVDSEGLVRCGMKGLTKLIALFIAVSFSVLCSCDLPVSEQSLPCLLFQGFGCFCTGEIILLLILPVAYNCNIIILRRLGKKKWRKGKKQS